MAFQSPVINSYLEVIRKCFLFTKRRILAADDECTPEYFTAHGSSSHAQPACHDDTY